VGSAERWPLCCDSVCLHAFDVRVPGSVGRSVPVELYRRMSPPGVNSRVCASPGCL
jgi:hypothetical protein